MIHYRPFLNSDPPAIAEIWRSQAPSWALIQPMTPAVLDELVFSKPYYDRQGLILALEDDQPVGFAHAGFGPDPAYRRLEFSRGTTALLLVKPHPAHESIAQELLRHSEQYLRSQGATTLLGGATQELAPYYFGLYGGSLLPGVLAADTATVQLYRSAGYREREFCRILRRELAGFRPPVDRNLMQLRRQFQLQKELEALPTTWWHASLFGSTDVLRFTLVPKSGGSPVVTASLWDIEPLASSWGVHAMGLLQLQVHDDTSTSTLVTFFLGELVRQLQDYSTTMVECQVAVDDSVLATVCRQLGFEEVDRGLLFDKESTA